MLHTLVRNFARLELRLIVTATLNLLYFIMKTIKVTQPYAILICMGQIGEVPIEVLHQERFERIYIYATEQVFNPQTPIELVQLVSNQWLYGYIDKTESLPVNAVVGFVDVDYEIPVNTPIWNAAFGKETCHAYSAHVFDSPINIPYDALENINLEFADIFPSHVMHSNCAWFSNHSLNFPLSEQLFFNFVHHNKLVVDVDVKLAQLVLDENRALREIRFLHIYCGNRSRSYNCEAELISDLDENGEPILYPSILGVGGREIRLRLLVSCIARLD